MSSRIGFPAYKALHADELDEFRAIRDDDGKVSSRLDRRPGRGVRTTAL